MRGRERRKGKLPPTKRNAKAQLERMEREKGRTEKGERKGAARIGLIMYD